MASRAADVDVIAIRERTNAVAQLISATEGKARRVAYAQSRLRAALAAGA
jgi:hypothetical protein